MSEFSFSRTSLDRMVGVDPRLIEIAEKALSISKIDFGIPKDGGLRTAERQRRLFEEGASNCDGTKKKSYHQTGMALDVYAYVDGRASWDKMHLTMVASAMLQAASLLGHKMSWGGLWGWTDLPHFQLEEVE